MTSSPRWLWQSGGAEDGEAPGLMELKFPE